MKNYNNITTKKSDLYTDTNLRYKNKDIIYVPKVNFYTPDQQLLSIGESDQVLKNIYYPEDNSYEIINTNELIDNHTSIYMVKLNYGNLWSKLKNKTDIIYDTITLMIGEIISALEHCFIDSIQLIITPYNGFKIQNIYTTINVNIDDLKYYFLNLVDIIKELIEHLQEAKYKDLYILMQYFNYKTVVSIYDNNRFIADDDSLSTMYNTLDMIF